MCIKKKGKCEKHLKMELILVCGTLITLHRQALKKNIKTKRDASDIVAYSLLPTHQRFWNIEINECNRI